jgi:photosystem II stability/assembly factor-like uncharacterized protein
VRKNWWYPQAPHHGHVRNIHIHPNDPKTIYLCLEHGGIVRSFDRGASWEDVSKGIDYLDIHVIANSPARTERYYVASARGFFTSDKPEVGWCARRERHDARLFSRFSFSQSAARRREATMLIAAADGSPGFWRRENPRRASGIFKSTDGAESWNRITNGLADDLDSMIWALVHHPTDHKSVFAGFGNVARGHASGAGGARRSNDQPRHGRQLGALGYRATSRSSVVGGGGVSERLALAFKTFKLSK